MSIHMSPLLTAKVSKNGPGIVRSGNRYDLYTVQYPIRNMVRQDWVREHLLD